jgi:hypothetical protein
MMRLLGYEALIISLAGGLGGRLAMRPIFPTHSAPARGGKWSDNPYLKKRSAEFGGMGTGTSQGTVLFFWRPEILVIRRLGFQPDRYFRRLRLEA